MKLPDTRPYRMEARAAAAAATGERILDAAIGLFWELPMDQLSLDEVARRAGVTVQTVIRRFGGKDGLFAAAGARESARVSRQRDTAEPGDLTGAIKVLLDHYEEMGDRVLKMLSEETRVPGLAPILAHGRELHRQWCARVFEPSLAALGPSERDLRLAQYVAACDVYTWKVLRHDCRLDRGQTERALVELLNPLMKGS